MVEIRSFSELLADLGRLVSSFRSLISYPGDDSIKHWYRLRDDGNTILNHIAFHSFQNSLGLFRSIPNIDRLKLSGWPSVCYLAVNPLFKGLIGFELEPRYRSFQTSFPYFFDDGSTLRRELCISPGLIFQPVIAVDPDIAGDSDKLWSLHKFEVLDRCARGCEMLIEIIENELKPEKPAIADDGDEIPALALKAVVDGGDSALINQALKVPAKQRYTATMRKMLVEDRRYYEWSLYDWANHLGASKKTIQNTDAWREIMEYREQNKQDRAGE